MEMSTAILNLLLYENVEGVNMMTRIFPRCLFKRFNDKNNLFKTFKWEKDQWSGITFYSNNEFRIFQVSKIEPEFCKAAME